MGSILYEKYGVTHLSTFSTMDLFVAHLQFSFIQLDTVISIEFLVFLFAFFRI